MNETNGRAKYTAPSLPKVAALYVRVSSEAQAKEGKTSPQTQLAALRAKASELGYATAEEYIYEDHHTGEELFERRQLRRLREDAHQRRFGLVLAYNVYALAKNQAHLGILLDEWERIGVGLQFATEQLENTPLGRLILNAQTFAAEMEGERRKDRVQRARLARALSGKPVGSCANYGYVWADTLRPDGRLAKERLNVNPPTAAVMVRMYEMVDKGMTLRGIAATLTAEGVPTPTGKSPAWDPTTVLKLLLNPIYCGRAVTLRRRTVPVDKSVRHLYVGPTREVPREEPVPLPADFAPALVSPELWARVAEKLRRNKELSARNNRNPTASILRGLVRCGYCDYRMNVVNTAQHGVIIRCHIGIGKPGQLALCEGHGNTILARKLDAAVWADVAEELSHPGNIKDALKKARKSATPGADHLTNIDASLKKIDRDIETIHKQVMRVDNDNARERWAFEESQLWKKRSEVLAERDTIMAHTAKDKERQQTIEELLVSLDQLDPQQIRERLDKYTPEEQRKTLLTCDVKVTVYRADHTPRYHVTMRPTPGTIIELGAPPDDGDICATPGTVGPHSVERIVTWSAVAKTAATSTEWNP